MNFRVLHVRPRTSSETDYFLKDDDNNDWTLRITGDEDGRYREFVMYPKHWKSLLTSNSLANLTRKSHLYELATKAIDSYSLKKRSFTSNVRYIQRHHRRIISLQVPLASCTMIA